MTTFTAALPLLIFLALVLVFRKSVLFSAAISFLIVSFVTFYYWGVDLNRIASASIKGVLLAADIALIVFGSLLIFESLKTKKLFIFIKNFFESISVDKRVHIVLVAWALVYFLEGVAGFGTPIMIAAPILVVLGFSPMSAVVLCLIGDAVPDIFGAIGLPITLGIGSTLNSLGVDPSLLREVSLTASAMNILGSAILPASMLLMFVKMEKKPLSHALEFIPFAFLGGLITSLASFLTAYFVGPDMVAVVGGFVGLIVIALMGRYRILMPKTEKSEDMLRIKALPHEKTNTFKAALPYILVFVLLIVSRLPFQSVNNFFTNFAKISLPDIFGHSISWTFSPLYAAGTLIIIAAIFTMFALRLNLKEAFRVSFDALKKTALPFISLAFVIMFVQIYVYSSDNTLGLPSMLSRLGTSAAGTLGFAWPVIAPLIGALGSFVSGSTTVSNLIFTGLQYETSVLSGFESGLILALQGIGAAAGGMVAFHNVLPALAVVGLAGKENEVMRKNMKVLFGYLLCIIVLGLFIGQIFK